ncbi:creatinine amidohydrolase [Gracilibacillus halotolerans]|uniref:Creatinine amidohydrolase n=1 Tax=Gracilibacillus halotolerans TaxID=74386 RepID=A0A841RL30_9BACI|nr:creatininase family protein [Gracilibacillus halotolerans]MBB6513461.1 creatinine amidohydrolase [Gracilibacillus halotolerans]
MKTNKVLYEELLPEEFLKRINDCPIAYLPLGTLEWHGYHLPLGSDGLQSKGFFMSLANKIGGIVLPMMYLGPDILVKKGGDEYIGMDVHSFEDEQFQQLEGSAYYVEEDLFIKMIEATLWNLSRAGFKIVVAHGHGPSTQAFSKSIEPFEKKFGLKLFQLWDLGGEENNGIMTDHAAYNETSLMMGLYPDLTDLEKLTDESSMVGIWGDDPRKTSEQNGRKIIEENIKRVGDRLLDELSKLNWQPREMNYSKIKKIYDN